MFECRVYVASSKRSAVSPLRLSLVVMPPFAYSEVFEEPLLYLTVAALWILIQETLRLGTL